MTVPSVDGVHNVNVSKASEHVVVLLEGRVEANRVSNGPVLGRERFGRGRGEEERGVVGDLEFGKGGGVVSYGGLEAGKGNGPGRGKKERAVNGVERVGALVEVGLDGGLDFGESVEGGLESAGVGGRVDSL